MSHKELILVYKTSDGCTNRLEIINNVLYYTPENENTVIDGIVIEDVMYIIEYDYMEFKQGSLYRPVLDWYRKLPYKIERINPFIRQIIRELDATEED